MDNAYWYVCGSALTIYLYQKMNAEGSKKPVVGDERRVAQVQGRMGVPGELLNRASSEAICDHKEGNGPEQRLSASPLLKSRAL